MDSDYQNLMEQPSRIGRLIQAIENPENADQQDVAEEIDKALQLPRLWREHNELRSAVASIISAVDYEGIITPDHPFIRSARDALRKATN